MAAGSSWRIAGHHEQQAVTDPLAVGGHEASAGRCRCRGRIRSSGAACAASRALLGMLLLLRRPPGRPPVWMREKPARAIVARIQAPPKGAR